MVRSEIVEMVPEESFSLHSGAFSIHVIEPKRIIDMNEYIYGPVTGHIVEIFGRQNKKKNNLLFCWYSKPNATFPFEPVEFNSRVVR